MYHVGMRQKPSSVRWVNPSIPGRLAAFTAHHEGMSTSAAISTLVDEGLRIREHPGIVFRDGPTGRRAALAAGSDVWEIVRSLRDARTNEPGLTENDLIALVANNGGQTVGQVRAAVAYYTDYPDDVDRMVAAADQAEETALAAWERRAALLS